MRCDIDRFPLVAPVSCNLGIAGVQGPTDRSERAPRFGDPVPADIAHAAVYLASGEAAFVTGSMFTADGGFTINGGGES
jgi:NAD(P)-dependent dehydrogenase (short-subunit alcohol dehydrogenase family)